MPLGRRSAGSQTPLERALITVKLRRRDPDRDIQDFERGLKLRVLCLTWSLGGERSMRIGGQRVPLPKPGYLHLAKGEPVVWRRIKSADTLTKYGLWLMSAGRVVRKDGKPVPLPKPGDRFHHAGADRTWRASRGTTSVEIPTPAELFPSDRPTGSRRRAAFTILTPLGTHDIAIGVLDEKLVRHVLT
jgi:hypothetical protein